MGPCSLFPVTLLVLFLLIYLSQKMKTLWSFRMFVTTYQMTQRNIPVDWNFSTVLVVLMCKSWSRVILSRKVLFSETLTVRKGPLNLYVACDAALWCPWRYLKWENVFLLFPWQNHKRIRKKFWKHMSSLFTVTYITLLVNFVKMCYNNNTLTCLEFHFL